MKHIRIIPLLVVLLLLFSTSPAFSESIAHSILFDETTVGDVHAINVDSITVTRTQVVYVPVTIIRETITGETTSVIAPQVLTITYRYIIYRDTDGEYTGGRLILNSEYPKLTISAPAYLNVSCSKISNPTFQFRSGNPYSVTITGGSFSITYNASVRYNIRDEIVSTTPDTVMRSYYYSTTGP